MKTKAKSAKRQTKIDGRNFDQSRRSWQPDWEKLEKELKRTNARMRRKYGPPINP